MGLTRSQFDASLNCPDEDSVFTSIFGYFDNATNGTQFFPGVGPITDKAPRADHMQGCCRTWVIMSMVQIAATSQMHVLNDLLNDTDSVMQATDHEIWGFSKLSHKGLRILRNSSFLFARKFQFDSTFPDFAEQIFGN